MTGRQPLPGNWSLTPSGPPDASGAFAPPGTGIDDTTIEADYGPLAERVLIALRAGQSSFLVTGVPPPNLRPLTRALRDAAGGRYSVIGVSSGAEIVRAQLLHASPPAATNSTPLAATERPPILFVLGEADRLSDEQLAEIHEMMLRGKRTIAAAVLLASPGLVDRLDSPALDTLRENLAVHYRLQQIDRDAVDPFLRRQIDAEIGTESKPAETTRDIASATGNDSIPIDSAASRVLEFRTGKQADSAKTAATPAVRDEPAEPHTLFDQLGEIARMLDEDLGEQVPALQLQAHPVDRLALREVLDELSYAVEHADREMTAPEAEEQIQPPAAEPTAPEACDSLAPLHEVPDAVEAASAPAQEILATDPGTTATPTPEPVVFETPKVAEDAADARPEMPPTAVESPPRLAIGRRAVPALILIVVFALAISVWWLQRATSDNSAVTVAPTPVSPSVAPQREPIPAPAQNEVPSMESKAAVAPLAAMPSTVSPEKPASIVAAPAPVATAEPVTAATPPNATAPQPIPAPKLAAPSPAPSEPSGPPPAAKLPSPSNPAPAPRLLPDEIAALIARGDAFLGVGDIVSARLFYERAAEAGDGPAALLVGETYDPALLTRTGLRRAQGDTEKAAEWYRRAAALGVPEAESLLKNLATR